jgi:hypothetical protein
VDRRALKVGEEGVVQRRWGGEEGGAANRHAALLYAPFFFCSPKTYCLALDHIISHLNGVRRTARDSRGQQIFFAVSLGGENTDKWVLIDTV